MGSESTDMSIMIPTTLMVRTMHTATSMVAVYAVARISAALSARRQAR